MLNYIWLALVLGAVVLGASTNQIEAVTTAAFESCKTAVMTIALPLAGVMALWLGVMRLAEKSGLMHALARVLRPLMTRLFPDVPADHPAMGSMIMNMSANMLGLANAATPLGLRAMQDLEKLNRRPGTATNAMCTFLALNTSSVQLIPASAVAILAAAGSVQPTAIIGTALVATLCSTIVGLVSVKTLEKLPFYKLPPVTAEDDTAKKIETAAEPAPVSVEPPTPLAPWSNLLLIAFGMFFLWLLWRTADAGYDGDRGWFASYVEAVSVLAIPFLLSFFPLYAAVRRVPVYEEFVEGAKEGIQVALRIIPFLVAILVAVGMFRAAGGIDLLSRALDPAFQAVGFPSELLPMVFMRPLSGSGTIGIFSELVATHGPDSLIARMAGTIMGSTETTFYVIAVYFGSVAIRRTRHAVPAGLLADLTGVIASVIVCRIVFA
ncbi:MAG: spore maturation protein [Chthoniobacterales bacterium]|nr:spore maturation protein [Chthoniobacterales bacterium]